MTDEDFNRLLQFLSVTGQDREDSGITDGLSIVIPYEDLKADNCEVRTIGLRLARPPLHYDLKGLYLAVQLNFLTDSNQRFPQYGLKQDLEYWFNISA